VDELEPPHPNGAVHPGETTNRKRAHAPWEFMILSLFVALVCIGIILGWTLVGHHSPERLSTAEAAIVSNACNDARAQLKQLPHPSPVEGGEVVTRVRAEDAVLLAMIAKFATVTPSSTTPAAALSAWTQDWSRMLDARERFATALAATKGTTNRVEFVIPATKGIDPVTDEMDNYVRENHPNLVACFSDSLELSTVEGPRAYNKVTS